MECPFSVDVVKTPFFISHETEYELYLLSVQSFGSSNIYIYIYIYIYREREREREREEKNPKIHI